MKVKIDALDITVLKGGAADIGDVGHGARLPAPARRARGPRLLRAAQPDLPRRGVRRRRGQGARPAGRRRHAGPHHDPDGQPVGPAPDPRPRQDRRRAGPGRRLPPHRPRARRSCPPRPARTASASTTAQPATDEPPRRPPLRPRAWSWIPTTGWLTKVAVDGDRRPALATTSRSTRRGAGPPVGGRCRAHDARASPVAGRRSTSAGCCSPSASSASGSSGSALIGRRPGRTAGSRARPAAGIGRRRAGARSSARSGVSALGLGWPSPS